MTPLWCTLVCLGCHGGKGKSASVPADDTAAASAAGTIYAIQDGTVAVGDSTTIDRVLVTGTASAGFWVQEPDGGKYSGIWVDMGGTTWRGEHGEVSRGSLLDITGTVQEIGGSTVLVADSVVWVSDDNEPVPIEVALGELATTEGAAPWEGVLVAVKSVSVLDANLGYGEWSVTDQTHTIIIDNAMFNAAGEHDVGHAFRTLVGILDHNYGSYKLEPRYSLDLIDADAPLAAPELRSGDLVFSEIMFDPEGGGSGCEWLEVHNTLSEVVDLGGLTLGNGDGSSHGDTADTGNTEDASLQLSNASLVEAGGYAVLALGGSVSWDETNPSSPCLPYAMQFSPVAYWGGTFWLDSSVTERLYLEFSVTGVLLDAAAPTMDDFDKGASWQVDPDQLTAAGNDDPANWCQSMSLIGGTGDLGTPASNNDTSCD